MAAFGESKTAPTKWAQRTDTLYVTLSIPDVKGEDLKVTEKGITFKGTSNDVQYAIEFEFFKEIKLEGSVWNVLPQSIQMKLNKKEEGEEFWPRLTNDKIREKSFVSIDWDRYVDEDEQDGDFDDSAMQGGMDMSQMMGGGGGMPGMGGMGGMGGMPGMGGMGGMPGMGGPGGPGGGMGGMDAAKLQELMAQMGGAGGGMPGMPDMGAMGGMPGGGGMPDMSAMGGMPDMGGDDADSDDGDDDLPDLEPSEG